MSSHVSLGLGFNWKRPPNAGAPKLSDHVTPQLCHIQIQAIMSNFYCLPLPNKYLRLSVILIKTR